MTRRERIEAELDDEIRLHLALRVEALMAEGMSRQRAEEEALRRFGPYEHGRADMLAAARHRERVLTMFDRMDALRHDLTYALRQIRRAPALAATIAVTFALGVGANATMFGIIDRLLLRAPNHVADPLSLVRAQFKAKFRGEEYNSGSFSYPMYLAVAQNVPGFASAAMYTHPNPLSLGLGADAKPVKHALVSGNYFQTLGTRTMLGRPILPDDDVLPTGSAVVVIGHGLWQRAFGSDPGIIGSTIVLAGRSYTVIGVAPQGFVGTWATPVDVWIPVSAAEGLRFAGNDWATNHGSSWMTVVGRLKAGITPELAGQQVLAAVRAHRLAVNGKPDTTSKATVLPGFLPYKAETLSAERRVALLLGGVSLLVLFIACANVANLLLSRAIQRRREIAVRLALGISRARLVRQLVAEGVLLSVLGGLVALGVVRWGSVILQRVILSDYAWPDTPLDERVLAFTAAATILVGMLAALVPAIQASSPNLSGTLKEGSRGAGLSHSRTRVVLLVAQAALSVILLVGTGLFVASLRNVGRVDVGLDVDRLVMGEINLRSVGIDSAGSDAYFRQALERARRLPNATGVALASAGPFSGWSMGGGFEIPGRDSVPRFDNGPNKVATTPGYFEVVGTRLLRGRDFAEADMARGAEPVTIINDEAARVLWPGENAIGKCIKLEGEESPCARIIGIAENTHQWAIDEKGTTAQAYVPFGTDNTDARAYRLLVRAAGDASPATLVEPIRQMMQSVMTGLPFADVKPMLAKLDSELRPWRLGATMFGVFGAIAIVLSALGLYSVVAYSVAQRTHEMGVRVALGAQARDIVRLVLTQGLLFAAAGVVIGVALALAGGRFVESLLFEVSPRDPVVYVAVATLLLAVAAMASLIPARRATRANPLDALRAE